MKNTKLIALVAVLLVVSVVVSVVISTSGNKDYSEIIDAMKQETQTQLDALKQANEALQKELDKAEQSNKDLQDEIADLNDKLESEVNGGNVSAEDYQAATEALGAKKDQLDAIVKAYTEAKNDKGELILDTSKYFNWTTAKNVLKATAIAALERALTVAQQDEIVAKFEADLKVIPTKVQELTALVASIEADGVTADDKDAVLKVLGKYDNGSYSGHMFTSVDAPAAKDFDGEDITAQTKTRDALEKRFNAALKDYNKAAIAHFVEMANALPAIEDVKISDKKAVNDVNDYFVKHLQGDLGLTSVGSEATRAYKKINNPDTGKDDLLERIATYEALKLIVDDETTGINATIKNAFKAEGSFKLNVTTLTTIENLIKAVNKLFYGYEALEEPDNYVANSGWEFTYGFELHDDETKFNEYVYNLVDVKTIESYQARFATLAEELVAKEGEYYDAVKALETVVTNEELIAAVANCQTIYDAINKIADATKVDTLLGNEADEDTGKYPFAEARKAHLAAAQEVTGINLEIKKITDLLKSIRDIVCENKEEHYTDPALKVDGKKPCDCETLAENYNPKKVDLSDSTFNAAFVKAFNGMYTLLTKYELTEAIVGEETLAEYKEVFMLALNKAAKAQIKTYVTDAEDSVLVNAQTACEALLGGFSTINFVAEYEEVYYSSVQGATNTYKTVASFEYGVDTKGVAFTAKLGDVTVDADNDVKKTWKWSSETQEVLDMFMNASAQATFNTNK